MRTLTTTSKFRKDLKRASKGKHAKTLEPDLDELVQLLLDDAELPVKYKDHPLVGEWDDCRDAHVKPDLVLIYRKIGTAELQLVRIGSHSELSL